VPQNINHKNGGVFSGINMSACMLIVPTDAVAAYQAAAGWNRFCRIEGF
jgi:hypothetical protein